MQWIDGFVKSEGLLKPKVVTVDCADAQEGDFNPETCQPELKGKKVKHRLDVDFQIFGIASANEYLVDTGLAHSDRHMVYSVKTGKTTYLIPAVVLARGLFRPFRDISRYLLMPQGIELLCCPSPIDGSQMQFVGNAINSRVKGMNSIQQPYCWLWNYPSARNMWNSIYRHALQDRFAMELPMGQVAMTVHGVRTENTFRVTAIAVLRILTTEKPNCDNDATATANTILFHDSKRTDAKPIFQARQGRQFNNRTPVLPAMGRWATSDEEWSKVGKVLNSRCATRKARYDHRTIFDLILIKLGTNLPWNRLEYLHIKPSLVLWSYQQWLKDSRLPQAISALNKLRSNG